MKLLIAVFSLLFSQPTFTFEAQAVEPSSLNKELHQQIESEKNTIEVFKSSSPLVVSVDSSRIAADFFSQRAHEVPTGSGTGFIWDDQGHVITNFHVVQSALQSSSHITITTKDNKEFKATLIGSEATKDIALLKVEGLKKLNLPGFKNKMANSKKLQVGQKVLAIGNPFGFEQTLTQGIVSATGRSMPSVVRSITIRDMIQTDASINPGNSGGPLIDSNGQLIGMNTAIISGSGSSSGIGFAVPSNTIQRIAKQIIKHGEVIQPGIGIERLDPYRQRMLSRYGYQINSGVVIESVIPNSPAEKAGLKGLKYSRSRGVKLGDVITGVNDKKVEDFDDLYNYLSEKSIGEKIRLKFKRRGKEMEKVVLLAPLNPRS